MVKPRSSPPSRGVLLVLRPSSSSQGPCGPRTLLAPRRREAIDHPVRGGRRPAKAKERQPMKNAETKSRPATAAPVPNPHLEAKAAIAGFLGEFNAFQSEIKAKLQEQETRLAMLDRKSIALSRPPLAQAAETDTPHKKAFAAYLRSGA